MICCTSFETSKLMNALQEKGIWNYHTLNWKEITWAIAFIHVIIIVYSCYTHFLTFWFVILDIKIRVDFPLQHLLHQLHSITNYLIKLIQAISAISGLIRLNFPTLYTWSKKKNNIFYLVRLVNLFIFVEEF